MSCCDAKSPAAGATNGDSTITDDVKDYYGKRLQNTSDLQTSACKLGGAKIPKHVREAIKLVHEEVQSKYYGCGLVIPDSLSGTNILDLGSGAGLDCYVLSKLVGEKGHVTGLDMTDEQVAVARKHIDYHTQKFGYKEPNIDFVQGYIEKLSEAGIRSNFYDIIISNCVVNLSPDKRAVLSEAYKALKEGGELYFSDVYSDKIVSDDLRKHKVLWGECISGALWWKELHDIASEVGFSPPRLVTAAIFDVENPELAKILGDLKFVSATYRLFKLPKEQESPSGAVYEGDIEYCPDQLVLDHKNTFKTGDPVAVNGEVATILKTSRFATAFEFDSSARNVQVDNSDQTLVDPFQFATKGSGGCCGPKSGGCC